MCRKCDCEFFLFLQWYRKIKTKYNISSFNFAKSAHGNSVQVRNVISKIKCCVKGRVIPHSKGYVEQNKS